MSVTVRKMITPWATWSTRWTDPRMAPYQTPVFLADLARNGVIVGPYLSERWELRDEFVTYAGKDGRKKAFTELNLRAEDFTPASAWLVGQPSIVRDGHVDLVNAIAAAKTGELYMYERHALAFVRGLCERLTARKVKPALSDEFQAKLEERDRRVDASARAVMAEIRKGEP